MTIKAIKGTRDIFGAEAAALRRIEGLIHDTCLSFGFGEIRTPVFEETELFVRSSGEDTDVVSKQMYSFTSKSGKSLTLKPEGTAPVVRAFMEHSLYAAPQPTKLYYLTPCFRYEQPQSGRQRQFHQFGAEVFGAASPSADAEVISLAHTLLEALNITNTTLYINSLGTPQSRKAYTASLTAFLQTREEGLCKTCQTRLHTNPLRVLDCKEMACASIAEQSPSILASLDSVSAEHFKRLQRLLSGLGIAFEINERIVRGLDYYTRTVFEFVSGNLGAQSTVCGGGRYDALVEQMGGPATPAVGFGLGMERLLLAASSEKSPPPSADVFLGYIGEAGFYTAHTLTGKLRKAGLSTETDNLERSVKAQLKYANKIGAHYCAIIGDEEVASQALRLKDMANSTEQLLPFDAIAQHIISMRGEG